MQKLNLRKLIREEIMKVYGNHLSESARTKFLNEYLHNIRGTRYLYMCLA